MLKYIVLLGAFAQLVGISSYIRDTLQGKTKPNRITWSIWALNGFIATFAAYSDGIRWAVIPVFMTGLATFLVFIASFVNPKAYWKLNIFDYVCAIFSLLALVFWAITKEPLVAIIFAIVSDIFATFPTIIKAWKYPQTESVSAYAVGLFNALTTFFALVAFNPSELAFPIYNVTVNAVVIFALHRSKLMKHGTFQNLQSGNRLNS